MITQLLDRTKLDEKQQKYFDKNFQKIDWASSAIQIFALVFPHKFYRKNIFSKSLDSSVTRFGDILPLDACGQLF